MKAMQELGLEKNTVVIATTDHGIAMPRAKCSVYEPGLQVALLLRHAGRRGWRGGVVRNEMVSNIDVLPSILELVGIPIPANVQGRSFAPLLDGRPYTPNAAIFAELTYHNYYDPRRSIRTETHKLIANFSSAPAFQDPSQQWRPKSDTVTPENPAAAYHPHLELYDLAKDPWEQADLASKREYARLRDELARRLYRHMVETADPLLRGAVTSPQHETTLNMLRGEPAAASRTPSPEEAVARFTAKVKWIEQIGKREANAMPIGRIDLRWLLGIEILSVEKADQLFARKGEEILLIHSPALFCRESDQKKILGKQYSFKVFGELKDGVPRYYDAEVTEVRSREKKGFHHSKGRRP
jgi:hypothetical protein